MPQGHPDWRRTAEFGVETLVDVIGAASSPGPTYGPFFIGRAANLEVGLRTLVQPQDLDLNYFGDQALTQSLGFNRYGLAASGSLKGTFPAAGLWVSIGVIAGAAGGGPTHSLFIQATERTAPQRFYPGADALAFRHNFSIGAGATVNTDAAECYGGTAHFHVSTNAADFVWVIESRNRDGLVIRRLAAGTEAGGGQQHLLLLLPPHRIRVALTNNDAAARTFHMALVPEFA